MKKIVIAVALCLIGFSSIAYGAPDKEYGWMPVVDNKGKITGMTNQGEKGGQLTLTCDVATKHLKVNYRFGGNDYDFYLFRKFGTTELTKPNQEGIFYVGAGMTPQSEVYYVVLNSDKAFTIARFPLGSKAMWDHAVTSQDPAGPKIIQEGDEVFLAGDGWKPYLKALDANCPISPSADKAIF